MTHRRSLNENMTHDHLHKEHQDQGTDIDSGDEGGARRLRRHPQAVGDDGGWGGGRRMRRGDIRRAILFAARSDAGPRLRGHAPARGEQRRRLAPQPRVGLPHPPDARRRGLRAVRQRDGTRVYELTDGRTETDGGSASRPGAAPPGMHGDGQRRQVRNEATFGQVAAARQVTPGRQPRTARACHRGPAAGPQGALPDPRRGLISWPTPVTGDGTSPDRNCPTTTRD